MEEEQKVEEPATETKIKKERSDAQKEQLNLARIRALEMRKQRADERKIKKEEVRIETKVSAIEKEKETLRLKQVVIENKTDPPKKEEPIETKKEEPPEPPKVKEPEPAKMKEPEPPKAKEPEPQIERNSFRFEGGNLMFYE
jgi:hypothetical protein